MEIQILLSRVIEVICYAFVLLAGFELFINISPQILPWNVGDQMMTISHWGFTFIMCYGVITVGLIGSFFDGVRNAINKNP